MLGGLCGLSPITPCEPVPSKCRVSSKEVKQIAMAFKAGVERPQDPQEPQAGGLTAPQHVGMLVWVPYHPLVALQQVLKSEASA